MMPVIEVSKGKIASSRIAADWLCAYIHTERIQIYSTLYSGQNKMTLMAKYSYILILV